MCSCLRGVSRWFTPLACGPGSPELSKSCMDMASKLFTFTFFLARCIGTMRPTVCKGSVILYRVSEATLKMGCAVCPCNVRLNCNVLQKMLCCRAACQQ